MKFAIITHVPHIKENSKLYAYAPYVREMNLWIDNVDEVLLVAPTADLQPNAIHLPYEKEVRLMEIPVFNAIGLKAKISALFKMPKLIAVIYKAMREADHIHLRCPGNVGLLGCFVQILFPKTPKTAKYAGNWDPKSKQPFSYKIQRWILSNTFLTKNMQVLVYGNWFDQTKNIRPFFTATYREQDKKSVTLRTLEGKIKLLFAGTLAEGKRPLYAVQLTEKLLRKEFDVELELFGDGQERNILQEYIAKNNLENSIFLRGNQTKENLQLAYEKSHFLLLPSKSEGWPKVVAEAMFWGCVPVSSRVSCVPDMLDYGTRGVLLEMNLEQDSENIAALLKAPKEYKNKAEKAMLWSGRYTLDYFESEIKSFLKNK
jgi:glycosyltransferase involved in cell wall biosynthesis